MLFRELDTVLGKPTGSMRSERPAPSSGSTGVPATTPAARPPVAQTGIPPIERDLLKLMLEHGSVMVRHVFEHMDMAMITSPTARAIIDVILQHEEGGAFWDAGTIVDHLQDPTLKRIVTELTISAMRSARAGRRWVPTRRARSPRSRTIASLRLHVQALDERIAETYRLDEGCQLRGEDSTAFQQGIMELQREKKDFQRRSSS